VASAGCQPLSGVEQSEWVMVHVLETDEHRTVIRPVLVLVPISEISVERTWNVAGMQAAGSNTVVLKDVFVPEHRIVFFAKILSGGYAADHSEEPLAAGTVLSFLTVSVIGPVLGMAEAALEHTLDILGKGKPIGASLYRNAVDSRVCSSTSPRRPR
jgi:alkylation response protein AidB-like acyl-CoA dehydrogenase